MDVMVSVVCLAYNHEKYIRKCLDGFVMQKTNFPFEVLINDDASTDGTARIIREYEAKYPDIIKPTYQTENQFSQGVKIVPTFLMPKAKGKYIAFCEGDDYWIDEHKLQKQFDVMEQNPEFNLCLHRVKCVREHDEDAHRFYPRFELESGTVREDLLIGSYNFQTSSYFCKKDKLNLLYTGDIEFAKWTTGDVATLIFFAYLGVVMYLDACMSCYRQNSVGSWVDRRTNKSRIEFTRRQIIMWAKYDEYTNRKYHFLLEDCIKQHRFKIALFEKKITVVLNKENRKYFRETGLYYILLAFFPKITNFIQFLRRRTRGIISNVKG